MVDARLSDGSRVNAIIPPLAVDGPLLSIRRFSTDKLMPPDLVNRKALSPGMMELLEAAVKARLNIIIAGGTGAGKTTLLNAMSAFINGKERIVTIEDAAELQLKQPHVARLETRPPNLEGSGAVRQRELLVNSLRMRPDRIVVGEVRGEEALDMLQAMNTGHDGSLTTVHANSPRDAVSRLEVMVSLANSNMQLVSIRQQIASAVNLLVQASRMSDGSRRVVSITEVTGMEGEVVTLQDLFVFDRRGLDPDGKVVASFPSLTKNPSEYLAFLQTPRPSTSAATASGDSIPQPTTLDGQPLDIPKGKVVVVDFWATYCVPCIKEIPSFNKLHQEYSAKGVAVIGIGMDEEGAAKIKPFLAKHKFEYPVGVGKPAFMDAYKLDALPVTLLFDRQGKLVKRYDGLTPEADLIAAVQKVL